MTLPSEINDYLQHIVQKVKNTMPVSAIYLFGSYASGDFRADSDLDIFITTSDKSKRTIDWHLEASKAIGVNRKYPLDIVVCYDDIFEHRKHLKYSLEYEVSNKGVSLYGA